MAKRRRKDDALSIDERVDRLEIPFNRLGTDPYGISKRHLRFSFKMLGFLYRRYFSVEVSGMAHVPPRGRAMLVGNHSGGVAVDGAMVLASMFFDMSPPRLGQGMAEKFINRVPFMSEWANRTGQFTGLPEHAQRLLEDERLLIVFPEGARGTAKLYKERYSLVDFGTGFVRLALKTKTPIIPFAFLGGGDAVPTISNAYTLGKLFGVPYVPITPYFFALPLPVKLAIEYGEPLVFEGSGSEDDEIISGYVDKVKESIATMIERGRAKRRGPFLLLARDVVVRVLIPGIAGAIARRLAIELAARGHEVSGVDARPWTDCPKQIDFHNVDIRKRAAEDVFRKFRPDSVVHMATVTALQLKSEERYRINLGGTRAVFEHCRAYGVKGIVFVGRHTFYGAGADQPLFHTEDEPPMALGGYPELADLVAADLYAATELWRFPEATTAVLRLCYTLGPTGHGTLAGFLRGKRVPTILGFDPLFQFMHEEDIVSAIILAVEKNARGVFNITGPSPLPLSVIAEQAGRIPLPLPEFVWAAALGRFGLPKLPAGALSHIKYPIVCDGAAFRRATGFTHAWDESRTIADFRRAFPPPL